jgi:hypothetical protein
MASKTRFLTDLALKLKCPRCLAEPNRECLGVTRPHRARLYLARKQDEEATDRLRKLWQEI